MKQGLQTVIDSGVEVMSFLGSQGQSPEALKTDGEDFASCGIESVL